MHPGFRTVPLLWFVHVRVCESVGIFDMTCILRCCVLSFFLILKYLYDISLGIDIVLLLITIPKMIQWPYMSVNDLQYNSFEFLKNL